MSGNAIAGSVDLTVNGTTYLMEGDCKWSPNSWKKETQSGLDRVHGYKKSPCAPFIEVSIRDSGGLTVADFGDMDGVTVTLVLANGKTVIGSGMWTVTPQEVDSAEGKFTVRLEGPTDSVTEVTAS